MDKQTLKKLSDIELELLIARENNLLKSLTRVKDKLEEICKEEFDITLLEFSELYSSSESFSSSLIEEIESRL